MEYTNSQITELIDEHIHNAKYREILKLRFVDGMTYDKIAERQDMSVRQTKNIVYKSFDKLSKYL